MSTLANTEAFCIPHAERYHIDPALVAFLPFLPMLCSPNGCHTQCVLLHSLFFSDI